MKQKWDIKLQQNDIDDKKHVVDLVCDITWLENIPQIKIVHTPLFTIGSSSKRDDVMVECRFKWRIHIFISIQYKEKTKQTKKKQAPPIFNDSPDQRRHIGQQFSVVVRNKIKKKKTNKSERNVVYIYKRGHTFTVDFFYSTVDSSATTNQDHLTETVGTARVSPTHSWCARSLTNLFDKSPRLIGLTKQPPQFSF